MQCLEFCFRQIVEGSHLCVLLLASCTALKNTESRSSLGSYDCYKSTTLNANKESLPHTFESDSLVPTLTEFFSPPSLKIAFAIGMMKELENLVKQKTETDMSHNLEKKMEWLGQLQLIHQNIMQAWLEISSVAGEMDCEEERADQIATYLNNKEDALETHLTAASIVIGAAGGLASGLLLAQYTDETISEMVGIGTGFVGTILGILILIHKKKTDFYHPRNVLKDIWEGPFTSKFFPAAIWYYLNDKGSAGSNKSLREELKERWIGFGQIDTINSVKSKKTRKLLLGTGGRYTAEQLTNRANMYDQVESVINLMKQDLKMLLRDLEKLYR